jgi:hypothetical protein
VDGGNIVKARFGELRILTGRYTGVGAVNGALPAVVAASGAKRARDVTITRTGAGLYQVKWGGTHSRAPVLFFAQLAVMGATQGSVANADAKPVAYSEANGTVNFSIWDTLGAALYDPTNVEEVWLRLTVADTVTP